MLLGVMAFFLIPKPGASPAPTSEISAVPVKVNFAAPDLHLSNINGTPSSLSDYSGQVILINNWATWCPPCKAEMPTLEAYYSDHEKQRFTLVGIEAGEPAGEVAEFVQTYHLSFPIWLDPKNEALDAFSNQSLPSSYVVNREGKIVLTWTGPISRDMLEKYVTPLLED